MIRAAGRVLAMLLAVLVTPAVAETGPVFSATGPDAEAFGAALGYPAGSPAQMSLQPFMVGTYSHYDRVVRRVARDIGIRAKSARLKPIWNVTPPPAC